MHMHCGVQVEVRPQLSIGALSFHFCVGSNTDGQAAARIFTSYAMSPAQESSEDALLSMSSRIQLVLQPVTNRLAICLASRCEGASHLPCRRHLLVTYCAEDTY